MAKDTQTIITGHQITVKLLEGKDLKPSNYFSSTAADAFITICTKNQVLKNSSVQYATCNPKWNESIVLDLEEAAMDDVVFVTLWGKHIISRNTFLGRIEIPVTAVVDMIEGEPAKMKSFSRWFKLLPKAGNVNFDAIPGRLHLAFSYNYIPLEEEMSMVGELSMSATASAEGMPANIVKTQVAAPQDPNSKLYFQCPLCTQVFPPAQINLHMAACKDKVKAQAAPQPVAQSPSPAVAQPTYAAQPQAAQPQAPLHQQPQEPQQAMVQPQQPKTEPQPTQPAQASAPLVTLEGSATHTQEQATQQFQQLQQQHQYQQQMSQQPNPYTYQMPAQYGHENMSAQAMAQMQLAQYGVSAPQASYYPALKM